MADLGAMIDASDFIFDTSNPSKGYAKVVEEEELKPILRTPSPLRRAKVKPEDFRTFRTSQISNQADGNDSVKAPIPSSPFKHVMGTLSRLSKSPSRSKSHIKPSSPLKAEKVFGRSQITRPFGFWRTEHCPKRDPPPPRNPYHHKTSMEAMKEIYEVPINPQLDPDLEEENDKMSNPFLGYKDALSSDKDMPMLDKGSTKRFFANNPNKFKSMMSGLITKKLERLDVKKTKLEDDEQNPLFATTEGKWPTLKDSKLEETIVSNSVQNSSFQYSSKGSDLDDDNNDDEDKSSFSPKNYRFDDDEHRIDSDSENQYHHDYERHMSINLVNESEGHGDNNRDFENKMTYSSSEPLNTLVNKVK